MVYYLNYDGVGCNVFESQILTPLMLMKSRGLEVHLINYEKSKDLMNQLNYQSKCAIKLGEAPRILSKLSYCNFIMMPRYSATLCDILRSVPTGQRIVLHARGSFAGYIALKTKERMKKELDIKVITDFRGLISAEYKLNSKDKNFCYRVLLNMVANYVGKIERYAAQNSDYLFCVSNKFKQYLCQNFKLAAEKVVVIPTSIDQDKFKFNESSRIRLRNAYGLNEKFVVAYCGGGQKWQCPELLFKTFINIREQNKNAKLLLITNEKELFEQYVEQYHLLAAEYLIVSSTYQNVSEYLSMADCALLLRNPDPVNEVASPTKFAEYLSCNLPVIASRNVGDIEEIINKYQVGILNEDLNNFTIKIDRVNRKNFGTVIQEIYSWDINLGKMLDIYDNLLEPKEYL
jgi:glycosyltransferase involved in cell wall biosynthesis